MAFIKSVTTLQGNEASYWRLIEWSIVVEQGREECRAKFYVYKDEATRRAGMQPYRDQVAKLRLTGDKFNQYFGPSRDISKPDPQIIYEAAAAEGVVSDFGTHDPVTGMRHLFSAEAPA